ncbi:MAG: hypothetical protein MI808_13960, partial [Pseudomonadales bacterium]|nr:hypothetical protein [Pseudomonadales bacterium]
LTTPVALSNPPCFLPDFSSFMAIPIVKLRAIIRIQGNIGIQFLTEHQHVGIILRPRIQDVYAPVFRTDSLILLDVLKLKEQDLG